MINAALIIDLAIKTSIVLMVFALGLKTGKGDVLYLLSCPGLLIRSILSMNVAMVGIAIAIASLFNLPFPVKLALIALAISPVPPILPTKQQKAGGSASYAVSLLVCASLAAIVLAPLAVHFAGAFFDRQTAISSWAVSKVVLVTVIAPMVAGIAFTVLLPDIGARAARPVSIAGTALLAVAVLPLLFTATETIWTLVGNGVALALVAFALLGLAIGHLLGGPKPETRVVLALATSTRHPGVALAIVNINFPGEKATLAVVLYHLVIGTIVCIPYVKWSRARAATAGLGAGMQP